MNSFRRNLNSSRILSAAEGIVGGLLVYPISFLAFWYGFHEGSFYIMFII